MKLENELNMTTNPSIWRIEGPEIVEQPTMKKPNDSAEYYSALDFRGEEKADEALSKYYAHCKTLRRYPHNLPDSLQGKYLREGEHFRLEDQHWTGSAWWPNIHLVDQKPKPGTKTRIIALPISQPEQPISEEGTFTKWLIEGNTIFFIDDLKELVRQVNEKKLMWSKFCEILNMKVFERYHSTPSPSQEAIEFAEWIQIENWRWTATWGWSNEGSGDVFYKTNELYQLYTEHKNSKQ